MKPEIILADDDTSIRTVLQHALSEWNYGVQSFDNGRAAIDYAMSGQGQVMVLDVILPDIDGLQLVPKIRATRPDLPIIIISAQNNILTALRAGREGVFDYLPKPFDLDQLHQAIERALPKEKQDKHVPRDAEKLPLIGNSPAMQVVYKQLARLVNTEMTVLIQGESGTGKELVAHLLHDYGKRRDKAFIALNMAAIPKDLIESELFGFEKGAFTGASEAKAGKFLKAHGGTIFLDEIGDMPYEAQTRLLRILQSQEFSPLGSHRTIKVDCRIIAATNQELSELVKKGKFREDLYYRLAVVPLRLPPLRERLEDIPDLVRHFCIEAAAKSKHKEEKQFTASALNNLAKHSWPGNVRELENLVSRLSVLVAGRHVGAKDINAHLSPQRHSSSLSEAVQQHVDIYIRNLGGIETVTNLYELILKEVETPLLALVLKAVKGNQVKAAALLGINRNTLRKKLRELHLIEK